MRHNHLNVYGIWADFSQMWGCKLNLIFRMNRLRSSLLKFKIVGYNKNIHEMAIILVYSARQRKILLLKVILSQKIRWERSTCTTQKSCVCQAGIASIEFYDTSLVRYRLCLAMCACLLSTRHHTECFQIELRCDH